MSTGTVDDLHAAEDTASSFAATDRVFGRILRLPVRPFRGCLMAA